MQKVILLNAPAGSGKDTAARFFKEQDCAVVTLAQPIDAAVSALLGIKAEDWANFLITHKDTELNTLNGLTPRALRISFAEEWVKPRLGKVFFAHRAVMAINAANKPLAVVTDLGFEEELNHFTKCFGKENLLIVHIERAAAKVVTDSRRQLSREGIRELTLLNNSTLSDLHSQVIGLCQDLRTS